MSVVPRPALLLLLILAAAQPGCVSSMIANAFTSAPNGGRSAVSAPLPVPARYTAVQTLDVPGPPPATLAYWTKEPAGDAPPRATVLLLHGWGSRVRSSDLLHPVSDALAAAGCRVVLPDLRGHGDSTGVLVTGGRLEVQDLRHLIDQLAADGRLTGPLGVAGHSYGGGIAVQLAAGEPRVRRALGLSPLADIRPAMLPGVRFVVRRKHPVLYHLFFRWLITQGAVDRAQQKMQQRTGADPAVHNALHRIPDVPVPVLILQGGQDLATPPTGARQLRDANPHQVSLHLYPDADHVSYFVDHRDDLNQRVADWARALQADTPR